MVAQIDRRIVHHLRRARSAAIASGGRASSDLTAIAQDLAFAMRHLQLGDAVDIRLDVPPGIILAMEREDLDEVLGNLLDNACRHARGHVVLGAQADGQNVEGRQAMVWVEDDGPGIPPEHVAMALSAGARLDETREGYDFGLAIVQELVGLYGGTLALRRSGLSQSGLGGLRVDMGLPRVVEGVVED